MRGQNIRAILADGVACSIVCGQEQSPASGAEELTRFSEEIRSLARPLGTDIDGNRFAQQQLSKGIKGRDKVSIKGFYSSMNWLKGLAGTNIKSIIDEYAPYDVETGFDGFKKTINEIRKNHLLRCRLLEFFGRKLEVMRQLSPDDLPERVKHNDPGNLKHPNHPGYPDKMTSPEYAAVLALSMIDGSFDPDSEDDMESDTRKDGTPIYGQHREAAHVVLASCCRQDSSE